MQPASDLIVLAYTTSNNDVKVAWAKAAANLDWHSGNFPAAVTPAGGRESGVGIMTDEHGVMHTVTTKVSSNEIEFVWGLGPERWDNTGRSVAAAPPETSPVGVVLDNGKYIVTYRRSGGTVAMMLYDASARAFVADVAPLSNLNTNVQGRPDIARRGNTIVVTWRRGNAAPLALIASVGTVNGANVAFSAPQEIPTPDTADLMAGVQSDPAIGSTDSEFVIAAVRKTPPPGLQGFRTRLFRSPDGISWTAVQFGPSLGVTDRAHLSLAGLPGGFLIAAAVEENFAGGPHSVTAATFINGTWSAMTSNQVESMFTSNAAFRPFKLIGVDR